MNGRRSTDPPAAPGEPDRIPPGSSGLPPGSSHPNEELHPPGTLHGFRTVRGRTVVRAAWNYRLPIAALVFLIVGSVAYFWPFFPDAAHLIWLIGLVLTGAPVLWQTLRGMLHGRFAADIVAALAIITAIILNEPLPGLVVVLMQTGGESLERYAEGRASAAVRTLEEEAPRIAHRITPDANTGTIEDIPAEAVVVGDLILVRPGEMVPCDGEVVAGHSLVDASRLTGEPVPVSAAPGVDLLSGSLNGEAPLTVRATRISSESQYARIVELVRTAQASKSPSSAWPTGTPSGLPRSPSRSPRPPSS